jgi:putative ABC transport system permease protein
VDGKFLDVMGLKLVAGRNFRDDAPGVSRTEILVNETFLERFKLGTSQEAIGKTVYLEGDREVHVAGVLEDFLFKPLTYALEPMILIYDQDQWNILLLQMIGNDPEGMLSQIKVAWHGIDPLHEARVEWFDDTLRDVYAEFNDVILIVGFLAVLAFVVSMLGLLGIVTLNAQARTKEVGIRKVLGADIRQIVLLLARREIVLLGMSSVVSIPLALLAGDAFISTFAYRIELGPAVVLPGLVLILSIAALILGAQSLRASRSNPVNALHYE